MSAPSFDCPAAAPDALAAAAWLVAALLAWGVLSRLPWLRLYRWAESVEISAPAVAAAAARLRAAAARLRAALRPVAESRRSLGRYLASLPPRSGLTAYEEWLEEARALPPGPARAAVYAELRRLPRPSVDTVFAARLRAGRPVVEPKVVAALLRGEEPVAWRIRRERAERRAA